MPVLVNTPEASDFSMTNKWLQPLKLPQERTSESGVEYHRFVSILVTAALAREEEAHPCEAPHHVLLKALKNDNCQALRPVVHPQFFKVYFRHTSKVPWIILISY